MIADRPFNITYYSKPSTLQPSDESRVPYTYPIVIAYSRRSVASTMLRYSTMLVLGWSTGIQVGLPVIVLRLPVPVLVVPVRSVALTILARLIIDFHLYLKVNNGTIHSSSRNSYSCSRQVRRSIGLRPGLRAQSSSVMALIRKFSAWRGIFTRF